MPLQEVLEGGPAQKRAEADKGALTCLYGLWQTKPWAPPAAAGARVPRNERGNVEAPPFAAALPVGTVRTGGWRAAWEGGECCNAVRHVVLLGTSASRSGNF